MEAMGARFRGQGVQDREIQAEIKKKTERACQMVMMRLASGTVELSTIQTLCILSMLEFTGKMRADRVFTFLLTMSVHQHSWSYYSCWILHRTRHSFHAKPED